MLMTTKGDSGSRPRGGAKAKGRAGRQAPSPRSAGDRLGEQRGAATGAKPRRATIVQRVLDLYGDSPKGLADALQRATGVNCTKQMVSHWRNRGNIPRNWVPTVSQLTRIPIEELVIYRSSTYEDTER